MTWLLAFFLPAFFALLATPPAIRLARRAGMMDHPAPRKLHREPTPRAGGIVLFPVVLAALVLAWWGKGAFPFLATALILIFLMGLWDDARGVHYSTKFFAQTTAALLVALAGVKVSLFNFPFPGGRGPAMNDLLNIILTLGWIVGITNAVNLIDGLDGLAAGLSINALLSVGVMAVVAGQTPVALFCFILAGGVFGFLRYNLHPAKAFLGDSGSHLLGFSIAVMSVIQSSKTATFLILAVPVLFVAIPMADTLLAFTRRLLRGDHPFKPDREHLHHRLLDLRFSPQQTLGYFYGFSALLGVASLALAQTKSLYVLSLSLLLLALMILAVRGLHLVNFHRIISRFNDRVRMIKMRPVMRDTDDNRIQVTRILFFLLAACDVAAAFLVSGEARAVTLAAIAFAVLLGLRDVVRLHRENPEHAFVFPWVSLMLFLLIGRLALAGASPQRCLLDNFLLLSFLLLAGGTAAVASFLRKRYEAFLIDPVVLLPLYLSALACGLVKHFTGGPNFLPCTLILVNSAALLFFFNIFSRQVYFRGVWTNTGANVLLLALTASTWLF